MSLDSFEFLLFLPLVFFLYWAIPKKYVSVKNLYLIIVSYLFYGFADWRFCLLLFGISAVTYLSGKYIYKIGGGKKRSRWILIFNITFCLLVLCIFKYLNFFAEQFAGLLGSESHLFKTLLLPVGLSFYVFMAISYTIDMYRGAVTVRHTFVDFFAYISFFPHLLAGPIDRGREIIPQLQKSRSFSYDMAADGMRQILCGLFKKLVIADNIGLSVDAVWGTYSQHHSIVLAVTAIFYSIQIYADFSGYSDMAIGVGKLFGIRLRQNFSYPYFSRNISEFWRGWHQSLTSWFTEYLYIPLGGNRKGKLRTILNTLIVFTLCGFWHGANWTFVFWGLVNGLLFIPLLVFSHLKTQWKNKPLQWDMSNIMAILVTFLCVTFCWIFFRAPSMSEAVGYIHCLFSNWLTPLTLAPLTESYFTPLFFLLVGICMLVEWRSRLREFPLAGLADKPQWIRWTVYLSLILLIFCYRTTAGTFIYQNF